MPPLIRKRLVQMLLIMVTVSLVLFLIFDSDQFETKIAVNEPGGFAVSALSDADHEQWLAQKEAISVIPARRARRSGLSSGAGRRAPAFWPSGSSS